MTQQPKSDAYFAARGGYAAFLDLSCMKCKHPLGRYQKDGPGNLKRLYADRFTPATPDTIPECQDNTRWHCPSCTRLLALATIYPKEQRACWSLFAYTIDAVEEAN